MEVIKTMPLAEIGPEFLFSLYASLKLIKFLKAKTLIFGIFSTSRLLAPTVAHDTYRKTYDRFVTNNIFEFY